MTFSCTSVKMAFLQSKEWQPVATGQMAFNRNLATERMASKNRMNGICFLNKTPIKWAIMMFSADALFGFCPAGKKGNNT